MFGFSLQKLLVFAIIVGAVWYGWKLLSRIGAGGQAGKDAGEARPRLTSVELEPCPVCGTYVSGEAARDCGRDDCPYSA